MKFKEKNENFLHKTLHNGQANHTSNDQPVVVGDKENWRLKKESLQYKSQLGTYV